MHANKYLSKNIQFSLDMQHIPTMVYIVVQCHDVHDHINHVNNEIISHFIGVGKDRKITHKYVNI